jgi:Mor family transcriptional regulator
MDEQYPEIFAIIATMISERLHARIAGMDPNIAAEIGLEAAERLREEWGGHQIYFQKGASFEISKRDMQVWEEFNGRNYWQLAEKYGLTEMRIRQVIAKVRANEAKRRQSDLFPGREKKP